MMSEPNELSVNQPVKPVTGLSEKAKETVAEVLMEKWESLRSKSRDGLLTEIDAANLEFAAEVIALAKNRVAVWENEAEKIAGEEKWMERTASHYPHIRLHGGALEDDVPPISGLKPN